MHWSFDIGMDIEYTICSKSTTFIKKIFAVKLLISIFAVPHGKRRFNFNG